MTSVLVVKAGSASLNVSVLDESGLCATGARVMGSAWSSSTAAPAHDDPRNARRRTETAASLGSLTTRIAPSRQIAGGDHGLQALPHAAQPWDGRPANSDFRPCT